MAYNRKRHDSSKRVNLTHSLSTTIQMKAIEQYFSVALFYGVQDVVLTFEAVVEPLKYDHSNESYFTCNSEKYTYFPVVLFTMLHKLVLTFECLVA